MEEEGRVGDAGGRPGVRVVPDVVAHREIPHRGEGLGPSGRILVEMGGPEITPEIAREAINRAIQKLPIKARFVAREESF